MATFAFLLLGIVASLRIPTSLMPDIDIPQITVQISYPDNSARELETNIVRPLRNQLLQVSKLKDIQSQTRDGQATLKLLFFHGTNTDLAFIETNEKIDASLNYLPKDLERPKVIKASATDIPILYLTVSLKNNFSDERFLELSRFAQTVLKKRIEQIPDIALADINGHTNPEIVIIPKKEKLLSLKITNNTLIEAIKQNNFEASNLIVNNGIYQYNFKFANPLKTKKDIENIYLNINQKLIKLKELADVKLKPQQEKGAVYHNGKKAIVLAIIKQANARVYNLKEALNTLTQNFIKDYPELEFNTNQDQSKLLKISLNNLKSSLIIGSILAILIMFFFIKDIKSPVIIAISIPVSLLVSIFLMYILNLSINIISLSGLILGVGMMIDNSIIVIDNITQKLTQGKKLQQACIEGTNEIITPLISSVLTTCSIFLPLLFLSGITGALFYDQAIAVSIGLGASLIVSIILIPVIFNQLQKRQSKYNKILKLKTQNIDNLYKKGYNYFFKKKWILYTIATLNILLAILLFKNMTYTQLPEINQNETILTIDWNQNINLTQNKKRLNTILNNIPHIKTSFSQLGESQFTLQREKQKSPSEATVYIQTPSNSQLSNIKTLLKNNLKKHYPNANINFQKPKTIFEYIFSTDKPQLELHIFSKTTFQVPPVNQLKKIDSLLQLNLSEQIPLKQTAFIHIIPENTLLYKVNHNDLINELKTAFNQNFIDNLKTSQEFIPIKLNYTQTSLNRKLNTLFVKNTEDQSIPVKNLVKITSQYTYKNINANRYGEHLNFNLSHLTKNNTDNTIKKLSKKTLNNPFFNIRFQGSIIEINHLKTELMWVIIVAILLLYFIMAAQFESLWQPLIILLEIPIDIGGSLLMLWLFGQTINIMAVIGIVVMSGVIINDSILKIHTINLLLKKEIPLTQAIKKAGTLRLKPILMTSLTTILALTPFLFMNGLGAQLQKPLALTVIGGMTIGTFISLYFIPLIYYNFYKLVNPKKIQNTSP